MMRPARAFVAIAIALALVSGADAQQFRWTDAQGKVHYTDRPPPGAKATEVEMRINSYSGKPTVSGSPAGAAVGNNVVLYTTVWCGYCRQARAYLDSRKIRYSDRDVEKSDSAREEYRKFGARGVPVILVGSQRMNGYSQEGLAKMLKVAGY